jgi:glutathione S-transferase
MTIIITAFERSPDGGKGLARDTRVRWALEEVGQPYEVRLVSSRGMKEQAHRARPAYRRAFDAQLAVYAGKPTT